MEKPIVPLRQAAARAQAFMARPSVERRRVRAVKYGKSTVVGVIRALFLIGFCFVILYPVISMLSRAVMQESDLYDNAVIWVPKHFTLKNLIFAWRNMDYPRAFLNSLWLSGSTTVLSTMSCMMAGYAFARFDFPLKRLAFAVAVLTIMLPPQQTMIPLYLHFNNFDVLGLFSLFGATPPDLLDSYWPFLALSATGMSIRNGLFIFIFRQYFRSVPWETEESAMVDGASALRIFFSIMLPGAVTMIATVVLFSFVWQWNDTYYTNLFLQDLQTLPKAYQTYKMFITGGSAELKVGYNTTDPNVVALLLNSGIFLVMVPLIAVYLFTQRYFVEGIERSGLVG